MDQETHGRIHPIPLKELPRAHSYPFIGHLISILKDPIAWGHKVRGRYGDEFIYKASFTDFAALFGPDALEYIWLDPDKNFASEPAYRFFFGQLAGTSLLLQDAEEHRAHRHQLNFAFKTEAMKGYLSKLNQEIPELIAGLPKEKTFAFYPAVKGLTLQLAGSVFLGFQDHPEREKVNNALSALLATAMAVVRLPIPGTKYNRGLKARDYIDGLLASEIPRRRGQKGIDIFSRLCQMKDAGDTNLSDDDIVGHMKTFWVAGHDTLASSLTTLFYHLAKSPQWQEKLRQEITDINISKDGIEYTQLSGLKLVDCAFKEALRMVPPALSTPRMVTKEFEFKGYRIPKGVQVSSSIYAVHNDPSIWPHPEKFDPMRFADPDAVKKRHRFSWVPFGGGAHMCIGLHFAQMQVKAIMAYLLPRYQISIDKDYRPNFQMLPTPRPKDGMPITLSALAN